MQIWCMFAGSWWEGPARLEGKQLPTSSGAEFCFLFSSALVPCAFLFFIQNFDRFGQLALRGWGQVIDEKEESLHELEPKVAKVPGVKESHSVNHWYNSIYLVLSCRFRFCLSVSSWMKPWVIFCSFPLSLLLLHWSTKILPTFATWLQRGLAFYEQGTNAPFQAERR